MEPNRVSDERLEGFSTALLTLLGSLERTGVNIRPSQMLLVGDVHKLWMSLLASLEAGVQECPAPDCEGGLRQFVRHWARLVRYTRQEWQWPGQGAQVNLSLEVGI